MPNILYIAQFFSTESEPGGQGQRHFKHVEALARDGHRVTVITSGTTTMQLRMQDDATETPGGESRLHPNIRLIKLPSAPLAQRSVISRAQRYFAFSFKAGFTGLRLLFLEQKRFQIILGSSPPLLIALVACILSILGRAAFYMEVRDLWSQTMAANGFINNPWAIWLNRALESFLYRAAKKIIIVSQAFRDEIEAQVPGSLHKIDFVPNGADMEFYEGPQLWHGSYLRANAHSEELFHVNYAGVFSDYTHLETLLEAAAIVQKRQPGIRFNLVGGGYQFERLRMKAAMMYLDNVHFWDALPKNRISRFLSEGDLSIINYRKLGIFAQVLPNKLFDYLAAGRPILAAVPWGEVSRVLSESGAGLTIEPENPVNMAEAILWFSRNRDRSEQMGLQGRQYVRRRYNRAHWLPVFLKLFPRVLPLPQRRPTIAARTADQPAKAGIATPRATTNSLALRDKR